MPLPTPRINESENEFIARCIVDAEIEEEYATMSQRIAVCYSQLDQKAITKSKNYDTQKYYQGYQRQLDIAERQEVRKVASYYANQYDQAIQKFLATGQTNNFQGIFKEEDIQNIYTNIYVNIGLRISKWYQSNYEKYTKKADANLSDNFFAGKFRYISQLVGAGRVRSVSQNKQQTLDRVLKKLMADPDFQSMNERDAQRLLRQQFKGISKYQAERIIRTESTLAANYATEQTARQMFNEQDMQKEWISGGDSRVRRLPRNKADHRTMNGKVVDADKKFEVPTRNGVEMMLYPGDPGASSFNLINCRCTVAYIPREDAQAQIDIQGFGVQDLGTLERVGENFGVIVNTTTAAEEVIEQSRVSSMKPERMDEFARLDHDTSYLDLVDEKVTINQVAKNASCEVNGKTINLVIEKRDYVGTKVFVHEYAHAIHLQSKLITPYDIKSRAMLDFVEKWEKKFGKGNSAKRRAIEEELENKLRYITFDKEVAEEFADYSRGEVRAMGIATADTIMALTGARAGFGHTKSYMKAIYGKMEIFAHVFENKYLGNPVFKKYFPELYDDMLKLHDELIVELKAIKDGSI